MGVILPYYEAMTDEKTIFERIIQGEIPSVKLYEDDACIVILDAFPAVTGQTLVIPRVPTDYAFDLDDVTYQHILAISKRVAKAIDTALTPLRTCLVIEGFEVPHAHIKLFPVSEPELPSGGGPQASKEELEVVAEKIRRAL
jgi:diadenosine tetraphosphate (Ap4A) HIT family hydrolase